MSFAAQNTRLKKPSTGMHNSDASLDTDSNGWSAKILSAPGGRGPLSELTSGSSAGQRSPLAPRPDVADFLPVACATYAIGTSHPGPPPVDMRSASAGLMATATHPLPPVMPQARIEAAEARVQGYIEPPPTGDAARRPAWPLPTRRVGRQRQRGRVRKSEEAGRGWVGDVVLQPTDTEEDTIMSQDDNYWAWEGSLIDPVSEIPEEPEGVSGFSTLTTSRSMPLLSAAPLADSAAAGDSSAQQPSHPVGNSGLIVIPDASDVSTEGPRYHIAEHMDGHPAAAAHSVATALGPPVVRTIPSPRIPRPARDGWGAVVHPRSGIASFPLPPLSPPLSPPPQSYTPPRIHLPAVPQLRQPSGLENSVPSSSLLFTPRLPSTNENDEHVDSKAPAAPLSTPGPEQLHEQLHAQLPVAAMATGDDSDVTQEARDGPAASAGASSGESALRLSDGDVVGMRGAPLLLGGLVSAAIGSDSSGCSLRMMSSPNPTDPAEHPDHMHGPSAPNSSSYPVIHPSGGPTTDLSLPQPDTLMSFDSVEDIPGQTLDSRVALAARAAQHGSMPNVWTAIAPGKVQLSEPSESFMQDTMHDTLQDTMHDTLQDTLQDTMHDSVLDTLQGRERKAAGDSLIEEAAAMPVAVAVAAWPPPASAASVPLRPHSAQPALVHAHSLPREGPLSGMHSPFQPARSFPNLQRVGSGLSNPATGWVPDVRSVQEIISTTTYQPSSAPDSSSRIHTSPVNGVAMSRGSSSPPAMPAALQFAPGMRFVMPVASAPPRPVSPKSTTSPHRMKGLMHFASTDGADSGPLRPYSSPGVSGALPGATQGHHRSSPLPPIQPGHLPPSLLTRRRVSSPGGGIQGLPLLPPPMWLQEPPTNSAYPRLMPQSAPVMQQHFDCGDLPEELAPSTLLDTWPPTASPPANEGGGASDADDERDSNGSESSDGRDSLDAALGESCVLPWGLPSVLQPAPASGAPLRSPAEAAGLAWDGTPPESPPQPPQSLPLPPIREESLGTEHLELLYQSDYASTPAASAMHMHGDAPRMPSPRGAAAEQPPVAAAAAVASATADGAENLDVSVSIAAAIPPAGGSSSARGGETERRLSGDVGRSALSASGSLSDGEPPSGPAADEPYSAMYREASNIVLQPRSAQPLSDAGIPAQGKGMFRFRKFLDVSRVKNPTASTSGPLPSPGGSSGSTLFPSSVRSRNAGPTPRDTHALDPLKSVSPRTTHSAGARTARGPAPAAGIDFLQESTSAPTLIGVSHFSNPLTASRDLGAWPAPASHSRVSLDTCSAPLRSQHATPRLLEAPSSHGTTASGNLALSGPLSSAQRAPHSMPERPARILHMLQPRPPVPPAADPAVSGSDADDEQEPAGADPHSPLTAAAAAAVEAAAHASVSAAALSPAGGGASLTSVDTGNSTLMSRLDSFPQPLALRTLTLGSAALPTIDSDAHDSGPQEDDAVSLTDAASMADPATQPGGTRGNPCEPPPPPPMVIADSSGGPSSTASTVAAAIAASAAVSAAVSAASHPGSTGSGPAAEPSSLSEEVEHSQRTTQSDATAASVSSVATSGSWASLYPRYIFHYSLMQLSARGRETPPRTASPATTSMMSGQHMLSPGRSVVSRRSAALSDAPRALAEEQRAALAGGVRSLPRLPLRRGSAGHGKPPHAAVDPIVSIGEASDEGEVFVDARSEFTGVSGGVSSVLALGAASAAQLESREEPPLERTASSLAPVNTAGTKSSEGVSGASNLCVADSTVDARIADLPSGSPGASPRASAHPVTGTTLDAVRTSADHPIATLSHSLLALSLDGLSSRAQSEGSVATPTARRGGASDASSAAGGAARRSPMLSPSGRYVAGEGDVRHSGARPAAVEDIDTPRGAAPGHDGLEVFRRRCPNKSLVTGPWEQGHVSWYVDTWDIRGAVMVTQPRTLPSRIIHPRAPPPRAPPGHVPTPPAHSATAPPLLPLSRRLSTHPEESGGSTMPVQSSLDWGSSLHFEPLLQMASIRPDLDADAHTHSVQLVAQEPLPPGWPARVADPARGGQTAPVPRDTHETGSADVASPGAAWMYTSLPANVQSEIGPVGAGRSADARATYGDVRPQSVGNHYTSVLRSALLPRSLGWGSHQRRADGKPSTAGRPPRPPSGPTGSASSSILQRCKRALGRASGRRSKHASAEVPARASGLTNTMSSFSSAPEMSTAMSPVVRGIDAESDAEVQMLPPMEVMAEDGEPEEAGSGAAEAPASKQKRARRWLPWRRRK